MNVSLTPRQAALYGFIRDEIQAKGVAPSVREMADHIGSKSVGSTHRLLGELETRGRIRRHQNMKRAIEILETTDSFDAARDALARVGAPATSTNLTRVAGVLEQCKAEAA